MNNISEIIIEKNDLRVVSEFTPAGDQPAAIDELVERIKQGRKKPSFARSNWYRQNIYNGQNN